MRNVYGRGVHAQYAQLLWKMWSHQGISNVRHEVSSRKRVGIREGVAW